MKTKEIEQLKNKTENELLNDLKKNKEKLWDLQVDLRAGKLKNVSDINKIKKLIARINTILNQKKNKNNKYC